MAIEVIEVSSGNILQIGANGQAKVTLYDTAGQAAISANGAQVTNKSAFPIGGYAEDVFRAIRVGTLGGLALNRVTKAIFQDLVDGAAVNTQQWGQTLTTMTVTQANGVVTMNAGNSVAATVVAAHTSLKHIVKNREAILRLSSRVRFNWNSSGTTIQIGWGTATTTTEQLVNFIGMRVTTAGAIELVVSQSSADVTTLSTGVSVGAGVGQVHPSRYYDMDLYWFDDALRCVLHHSDGTTSTTPVVDSTLSWTVSQTKGTILRSLPVLFRILNVSAPAQINNLFYSGVEVVEQDIADNRPYPHALAGAGRSTTLNPASGAQLANYANSAAPVSATLSNTAAGYTTLGGQWQFAAVAGAETDYALFGYTVPTGYTLYVTNVRIDTFVMGAAVATTPTLLQWGLGRATAVTLASNSFRKTIGAQVLAVGTAIGGTADKTLSWHADAPFVVDSAQFFHIILKMPVGTATASSIIRGVATIEGYLE